MSAPSARVLRGGGKIIKSTELVPGDVIEIQAGDMVPADCRLIETASLRCDESALTGESVPVEKNFAAEVSEITRWATGTTWPMPAARSHTEGQRQWWSKPA